MNFQDQRLLLSLALLLGIGARASVLVMPSAMWLALLILGLNIGLCIVGATTAYRCWWIAYAVGCVATMLLVGITSPVSFLLSQIEFFVLY